MTDDYNEDSLKSGFGLAQIKRQGALIEQGDWPPVPEDDCYVELYLSKNDFRKLMLKATVLNQEAIDKLWNILKEDSGA